MGRLIDLTGQRFGRLTVIGRKEGAVIQGGTAHVFWDCACDCGARCYVNGYCLRHGITKSCGCLFTEAVTVHGESDTGLYRTWGSMKARCLNPKSRGYRWYGEKGISVCTEWMEYPAFSEWAMSNGYSSNLTIDRIDPSGNYCPENCRWITRSENSKRTAVNFLSVNGETKSVQEWQRLLGTSKMTIRHWIDRRGEEYATTRIGATLSPKEYTKEERDALGIGKDVRREITINGETLSYSAWSKRIGMCHQTVSSWVDKRGESYAISRIQSALEGRE